ncbi:ABC transporter ATP-binding protein [Nisaea acidiphila]|uniref:ABC transporter ATP-binding protein n=1 Tax=Nisaea acidiphila TaxID=1862145 RepID=A0A9J7AW55_9PROT|nr:ABC transporter ATP-binding protein [Nisaea acidiphila]UUX51350.1 ABC transporter ATP-binding protein [Nisaea acidiphila]
MLRIEAIETFYGASQVLFGMSLEVGANEVVTLMGRNGMGKTTTVNSIMGIVRPAAGRITFENDEITNAPAHLIARHGLGLVPEGRQVFPNLSVRENLVATAANRFGARDPWTVERVLTMFPELEARITSMANLLSGGEQQMLAIGRALMTNPKLLILDEATEGLAPLIRKEIWHCLERLKVEGQAILVIDKNIDDLKRIADRHYIVEKGKVVWSGTSAELDANAELVQEKLGV